MLECLFIINIVDPRYSNIHFGSRTWMVRHCWCAECSSWWRCPCQSSCSCCGCATVARCKHFWSGSRPNSSRPQPARRSPRPSPRRWCHLYRGAEVVGGAASALVGSLCFIIIIRFSLLVLWTRVVRWRAAECIGLLGLTTNWPLLFDDLLVEVGLISLTRLVATAELLLLLLLCVDLSLCFWGFATGCGWSFGRRAVRWNAIAGCHLNWNCVDQSRYTDSGITHHF